MLQCAGVFGVKLRIVMCPIIGDGVMFDDGQRQLDPHRAATLTTHNLCPEDSAQDAPHLATIAKRFSAMARLGRGVMSAFQFRPAQA